MTQHIWHVDPTDNARKTRDKVKWSCDRCGKKVTIVVLAAPDDADLYKDEDCDLVVARQVMES